MLQSKKEYDVWWMGRFGTVAVQHRSLGAECTDWLAGDGATEIISPDLLTRRPFGRHNSWALSLNLCHLAGVDTHTRTRHIHTCTHNQAHMHCHPIPKSHRGKHTGRLTHEPGTSGHRPGDSSSIPDTRLIRITKNVFAFETGS